MKKILIVLALIGLQKVAWAQVDETPVDSVAAITPKAYVDTRLDELEDQKQLEKNRKDAEMAQKKAEKAQNKAEKAQKEAEKEYKKAEKERKKIQKEQDRISDAEKDVVKSKQRLAKNKERIVDATEKYNRKKAKGKLSPNDEEKMLKCIQKLTDKNADFQKDIEKAENKLHKLR